MSKNHFILRNAIRDALHDALFTKMDLATVEDIPKRLIFEIGVPILPATDGVPEYMVSVTGRFDLKVVQREPRSGAIADMVRRMAGGDK